MQAPREVAYLFAVPQAATLARLVGAQADMMQVVSYCDLMLTRYAGEHLKQSPFDIVGFTTPLDATDWEALSSATCVAYSRCFKTGVRHGLDVAPLASERPDWGCDSNWTKNNVSASKTEMVVLDFPSHGV